MKKTIAMFLVFMFMIYSNQSYVYALGSIDEFNQSAMTIIKISEKMSLENTVKINPGEVKTLTFSKETSKITKQLSFIDNEVNKMKDLMLKNKVSEKELNLFCDLVNKNMSDTFHLYPIINDLNEYIYTKNFSNSTKTKVISLVSKYNKFYKNVSLFQTENLTNYKNPAAAVLVCALIVVAVVAGHEIIKKVCKWQSEIDHSNQDAWGDVGDETGINNPHPNNPNNGDFPSNTHDTTQQPNQNNHHVSQGSHGTNETHTGTHEVVTVPPQTGK